MKMIIGFVLGITLASAMAQDKSYIDAGIASIGIPVNAKLNAHLDSDELAAIREACK